MSDLYDDAAIFPARLIGAASPIRYAAACKQGKSRETIRWRERRGTLRRPFHGVLLETNGFESDPLDLMESALLLMPPAAAFGFHTAAALHGFGVLRSDALHIVVPAGTAVPQIAGIAAHQAVVPPAPIDVLGLPCVPAARTAVDLARTVRRLDALPVLDAALRCRACLPDDLLAELPRHDRLRGVRQARELVVLADPRAECRQESQLRLILRDGRLPPPTPQLKVADDFGRARYRLDLGYEDERVGVEFDGASHLYRGRLRSDRKRHNWLEERGWAMRYFTDEDLYGPARLIVGTVRAAMVDTSPRRSRANGGDLEIK